MVEENKQYFMLIAIVAIVAIVALVVLVGGRGTVKGTQTVAYEVSGENENINGQAIKTEGIIKNEGGDTFLRYCCEIPPDVSCLTDYLESCASCYKMCGTGYPGGTNQD